MVLLPVQYQVSKVSVSYSLSKPTNDLTLTHVFCLYYIQLMVRHKMSSVHFVKILLMSSLNHVGTSLCARSVLTEPRDAPFVRYRFHENESSYVDVNSVLCLKILKRTMRNLDSSPSHIGGQGYEEVSFLTFFFLLLFVFVVCFFTMEKAILSVAFMYTIAAKRVFSFFFAEPCEIKVEGS